GTILPGLVEAHFHATYFNILALEDLDIKYPVEYVSLLASVNCRLALECGYTAARSGGCLFNIDVWLKKCTGEVDDAAGVVGRDATGGPTQNLLCKTCYANSTQNLMFNLDAPPWLTAGLFRW